MDSIEISESLLMGTNSEFQRVDLSGADIGNQLSAIGAVFSKELDMNSITVGGDLLMREETHFSDVDLVGARVDGTLSVVDSVFDGDLSMDSAFVGDNFFLERAKFRRPIDMQFVHVGSNLDLRATSLTSVDLTSARITGDFRLGSSNVKEIVWSSGRDAAGNIVAPRITLLNTTVGILQDTVSSWPDELERELQGFTYGALGGFGAVAEDAAHVRESDWFIDWLDRDNSFSPQPYRHLAQLLVETGHAGMATDVRFGSRVREREELSIWEFKWWMLWGLQLTVGFGYGNWNFLALGWAGLFIIVGTTVLRVFREDGGIPADERLGIWYSIDMLLPVIRLRERHYEIDLFGKARYYFFFHKIVGYLLTFFVIAGLSGLAD